MEVYMDTTLAVAVFIVVTLAAARLVDGVAHPAGDRSEREDDDPGVV